MSEKGTKIGQMLKEKALVTEESLSEALNIQKQTGEKIGDILIRLGYVSEDDFIKVLAQRIKVDYVDLNQTQMNVATVRLINENFARENSLISVEKRGNTLVVAMKDPVNLYVIEDLRFMTNMEIKPVIASPSAIETAIDDYYIGSVATAAAQDVNREFVNAEIGGDLASIGSQIDTRVEGAPVVRLVNSIILQAVKSGASDIHIEPTRTDTRIRMRIDGHLREVLKLSIAAHGSIVTRLKIMSSMNIAERRLPLDGRCEVELDGQLIDMRVSTLPTVYGEKAVIRLLTNNITKNITSKETLGMSSQNLELFEKLIQVSNGVILVTGPTGSGKTTTLYTIINEIMSPEINVVTIEDPVEFKIDGANQMQINSIAGLTFATGLRSILRQDPDVIMIGEIRDDETASIAIRAAITGHIVLSTLHTNDAATAINRLVDMSVKPYLVSAAVSGIIAQRLVRRICTHCKTSYSSSENDNIMLELKGTTKLYKGSGCINCSFTGYKGRAAVHEIIVIDDNIRTMIIKEKSSSEILEYALKHGTITLKNDIKQLVLSGLSTVEEYINAAYTL
jgi:type IV pilus assembly protein PilB